MSFIILAAAYYRITLSDQDAYLALAEAATWLVLVLTCAVIALRWHSR